MDKTKKTIVYVFGPKSAYEAYQNNQSVEWLKIGLHSDRMEENSLDASMSRINQECKTGIPFTCHLYDVFDFPYTTGKTDNAVRDILSDLHNIESSKENNKLIDNPYDIKAGQEFVYNVTRTQVVNAVNNHKLNVLLNASDEDILFVKNMFMAARDAETEEETTKIVSRSTNPFVTNAFWDSIMRDMPTEIKMVHGEGNIYCNRKRISGTPLSLGCSISARKNRMTVCIEHDEGQELDDHVIQYINKIGLTDKIICTRGVKNSDRCYYKCYAQISETEDEIRKWFYENLMFLYQSFKDFK